MNMRIAVAAVLLAASPALAQDAAKNAAVDRLYTALNAEQLYTMLGNQMLSTFVPLLQMNPGKEQQVRTILEGEIVPELRANRPVFTRALKAAYAKRMTAAEMNTAAAFLESSVGKKLSAAQRDVPAEAAQSLAPLQKKIETALVPRIFSKMKTQGLRVPQVAPASKAATTKK